MKAAIKRYTKSVTWTADVQLVYPGEISQSPFKPYLEFPKVLIVEWMLSRFCEVKMDFLQSR
jgi:hypothetical protein